MVDNGSLAGSARNTANVFGQVAQLERHEQRPVHVVISMDATISRDETIAQAKRDFETQMGRLREVVEQVSAIENLKISLAVFGGGRDDHNVAYIDHYGPFERTQDVAAAFSNVRCVAGATQIAQTLNSIKSRVSDGKMEPVDALIHIGDTADSGRSDPDYQRQHKIPDMIENLENAGSNFDAPIITLIESTRDTQLADKIAFQRLSEASGVNGCPIPYNGEITFVDYVVAVAAAKAGPDAVQEAVEKGLVDLQVFEQLPEETIETIHEPEVEKKDVPDAEPVAMDQYLKPASDNPESEGNKNYDWAYVAVLALGLLVTTNECTNDDHEFNPKPDSLDDHAPSLSYPGPPPRVLKDPSDPSRLIVPLPDFLQLPSSSPRFPEITQSLVNEGRLTFDEVSSPVNFAKNSAELSGSFKERLQALGEYLEANPDGIEMLIVEGYASPEGPDDFNLRLSQERADAVVAYLEANFDIEDIDLQPVGFGETELLFDVNGELLPPEAQRRVGFVVGSNEAPAIINE